METQTNNHAVYVWRLRLVLFALLCMALAVAGRIVYLHTVEGEFLKAQGDDRSVREVPIPGHRGMLLDRNGEPLAVSAPVESVWLNPKTFVATDAEIKLLAERLDMSAAKLKQIYEKGKARGKGFVYLRRHLTPAKVDAVMSLNLAGINNEKDYKRYYPAGEVATHLVGFTNVDGKGLEGLELAYDSWLKGENGEKLVLMDRDRRIIKDLQSKTAAKPGHNLQLSIDLRLQYLAYRELKAAVTQHKAKSGSAVIIDVNTGEVLAMVNQPSYNPNDRSSFSSKFAAARRNRAITDTFEPGSTMKPLTIAAALSSGKYHPNTLVDTSPGYLRLKGHTIRDHRNYKTLDVTHIISKSSNVGAVKLALSLEPDAVRNLFQSVGLGQDTGSGFPGERVGSLPYYSAKQTVERATLSYGYGLAVTPLQLAQAYAVLGAGGIKRPLSLTKVDDVPAGQQIIPRQVASQVLQMMELVTQKGGTGRRASVPSFRVAGKTGTVHKVGSNGYEDERYVAVFAGVAPASKPRYAMVVMVDEPQVSDYYGGEVAAPVFSRIMAGTLRVMNVAPDIQPKTLEQQMAWH